MLLFISVERRIQIYYLSFNKTDGAKQQRILVNQLDLFLSNNTWIELNISSIISLMKLRSSTKCILQVSLPFRFRFNKGSVHLKELPNIPCKSARTLRSQTFRSQQTLRSRCIFLCRITNFSLT